MSEYEQYKESGRPTVMTPEVLQKLEQAFAYGSTDKQAAFYAGISARVLYDYCRVNPEFRDRKEALKDNPIMLARKTVIDAMSSDPALAFKYLERKQKDEFSSRTEVTGPDGDPITKDDGLTESVRLLKESLDVAIRQAEQDTTVATDASDSQEHS